MKSSIFRKLLDIFLVLALFSVLFACFVKILLISKKSPVVPKPAMEVVDWMEPRRVFKPETGFISSINPDATIEYEKYEKPIEPSLASNLITSGNTVDSFDVTKNLYRRKIVLDTSDNQRFLSNYIISISLDILTLIRESKVSFQSEQIYFTDEDGKTVISHWTEKGDGKEKTKFWIRIPTIKPKTKKSIFIYYGNDTKYTYSNFKTTFLPEKDLIGWYYFNEPLQTKVLDFSGSGNHSYLSTIRDESNWYWWGAPSPTEKRPFIFFNDWEAWKYNQDNVYFSPTFKESKEFEIKGTLEVQLKMYILSEKITQHFLVDSKQHFYLGILPDGSVFLRLGSAGNQIVWDANLKKGQWYHFVCSWDFSKKSINIYVNGKHIKQFPQKVPFIWNQNKSFGDLKFGGYHTTNDEFGFAGFLDCLKLYNRALTKLEAVLLSGVNQSSLRFPEKNLEKEEKVSSKSPERATIDLANLSKIGKTDRCKINLLYASPYNSRQYKRDRSDQNPELLSEPSNIIDREEAKKQPIFGFDSHFYSYLGTQIIVSDQFLVSYVGLRMNDPKLIETLSIDFAWMHEQYIGYQKQGNLLDFFITNAFACGPGYSYQSIGCSQLIFYSIVNGIYWYKLANPVFIDPTVTIMQMYYQPTKKVGLLQLQLADAIFMTRSKQIVRPEFYTKDPVELPSRSSGADILIFPSQYKASFLPNEKGSIDFRQNKVNGLDLMLKNQGYDKIILDLSYDNTFQYWQQNLFTSIQIYNSKKQQILNISLEDIRNHIMNKEIAYSHLLHFPIIESQYIPKDNQYFITFCKESSIKQPEKNEPSKLVSWILGNDPYRYFYPTLDGKNILYELFIDNQGKFHFSIPKS